MINIRGTQTTMSLLLKVDKWMLETDDLAADRISKNNTRRILKVTR